MIRMRTMRHDLFPRDIGFGGEFIGILIDISIDNLIFDPRIDMNYDEKSSISILNSEL